MPKIIIFPRSHLSTDITNDMLNLSKRVETFQNDKSNELRLLAQEASRKINNETMSLGTTGPRVNFLNNVQKSLDTYVNEDTDLSSIHPSYYILLYFMERDDMYFMMDYDDNVTLVCHNNSTDVKALCFLIDSFYQSIQEGENIHQTEILLKSLLL